jgi:thiamine biosynthesis lipoprotein
VNLGGNVIAVGGKPNADGFTIGVEKPFSDSSELIGSVQAENQTVVTSGVYERQFEIDGKIYHHILSTTTGYPVSTDLDSVTIITDKGHSVDADALSTICLISGSKAGKELIESIDGYEALFCLSDGSFVKTSGMKFDEK